MIIRETINVFKIENINEKDIPFILDMCSKIFDNVITYEENMEYLSSAVDWKISKKGCLNGEIIGVYLFNEDPLPLNISKYNNKKALQGVALALNPKFRGMGYGKQLRDVPLYMNYDYIWSEHLKGLHNINDWLKFGRKLIFENDSSYFTVMNLSERMKQNINENFNDFHSYQKDWYTCGTTCVKMVADYLNIKYKDIEELIKICQTTITSGTTDVGIKNALDELHIKYNQNNLKEKNSSLNLLDRVLNDENIFIMRTLTRGIKHWIIIYGKKNNRYLVADPWLGLIDYNKNQIIKIWEPRNFDGFTIFKSNKLNMKIVKETLNEKNDFVFLKSRSIKEKILIKLKNESLEYKLYYALQHKLLWLIDDIKEILIKNSKEICNDEIFSLGVELNLTQVVKNCIKNGLNLDKYTIGIYHKSFFLSKTNFYLAITPNKNYYNVVCDILSKEMFNYLKKYLIVDGKLRSKPRPF